MKSSNVSVVVCTKNNKDNIGKVLRHVILEEPSEILVVDGNSTDGTREIVETMPVRMITDPGKGLAYARNMALGEVHGKYTMFVGDDNLLVKGSIEKLEKYISEHGWCGGALQTRLSDQHSNYWSLCSNLRWKARFYEGERAVIGTPYMFETELLKEVGYDEKCADADDSDMELRISQITDKKFGYSNLICYEIGRSSFDSVIERYLRYGKSDAEYWKKYSGKWGYLRKVQSLLHPISAEFTEGIKGIKPVSLGIFAIPFLCVATTLRYIGWIKHRK